MSSGDLVAVMVPKKHLPKVYGFIAKLDEDEGSVMGTAHAGADTSASDEWTPSRIRVAVQQSPPAMRDILRALAERPGEWLNMTELAAAIQNNADADWKTVAGTLGAFGRRVANRYGLESMPWKKKHDHASRCIVIRMDAEMARQILQALNNAD